MDITELALSVIGLLGAIITGVLVPLIRSKTTGAQQVEIAKWVKIAVSAAEQIFTQTSAGQEKKQWVLEFLEKQGIRVDDEAVFAQVDALIEAFVAEMNYPNIHAVV